MVIDVLLTMVSLYLVYYGLWENHRMVWIVIIDFTKIFEVEVIISPGCFVVIIRHCIFYVLVYSYCVFYMVLLLLRYNLVT